MLYVVGQAQELHFRQVFAVLERMGLPWAKDCGAHPLRLGEIQRTSTSRRARATSYCSTRCSVKLSIWRPKSSRRRAPTCPTGPPPAEAVGIGAVVFSDLATRRIKDVNFDWEEVLSFDYGSGPYVQYAHARLCSILRKYGKPLPGTPAAQRLTDPGERLVLQKLERFPRQLELVAQHREPSYLCSYLVDVASAINSYLQKGPKTPTCGCSRMTPNWRARVRRWCPPRGR